MSSLQRLQTGPNDELIRELITPTLHRDYALFFRPLMATNRAHVVMLVEQGILGSDDAVKLFNGLDQVDEELTPETLNAGTDLYLNVEKRMHSISGPAAGRMHTARSRNDLQACYQRMAVRATLHELLGDLIQLRTSIIELATAHVDTIMPGFTHLQPAQPITFGHWLLGVHDAFERDETRLQAARLRTNLCPLGAGALATTGFPINRELTAELLAFDGLIENSIDAVASRDYVLEALSACVGLTSTASRMSADLIAWSGWEYRFVEVADGFATSSSIMPQKKNTMALDHIRAKMANVLGAYTAAATLTKGLAFTQMRETSSEIFHLTFNGFAEAGLVTRLLAAVLRTLSVNVERMAAASDLGYTTATELADTLVKSCRLPFKTAHDIVATLVARSVRENLKSGDWGLDVVREVAGGLGADVSSLTAEELFASLDPRENVSVRKVTGGPAPGEVSRLLEIRRGDLVKSQSTLDGFRGQLQEASQALANKVSAIRHGGADGSAIGNNPPTPS